jgi:hypothetical protein
MNHGLNNTYLYSACKILSTFSNGKESVALIGTGFFINTGDSLSLITNRHVVDIQYKDYPKKYIGYELVSFIFDNHRVDPITKLPTDIIQVQVANFNEFIFPTEPLNDIACLNHVIPVNGDVTIDHAIPINIVATEEQINTKLSVCDFVAFPGFPDWYDRRNNSPILRTGAISSDPRFDYSNTNNFMGNCMAFEAFSFGGSSGSPVFAIQKGVKLGAGLSAPEDFYREVLLIGINAGHFPAENKQHSGISYLFKSSEILKLITAK